VRPRGDCKRALGTRAPLTNPQGPNQRCGHDFLLDAFVEGRRFRIHSPSHALQAPSIRSRVKDSFTLSKHEKDHVR
jgi:hypothetical protein